MFSDEQQRVTYFGSWHEETRHIYRARAALAVIGQAVQRCKDEDLRQDRELSATLAYLVEITGKRGLCEAFTRSLSVTDQLRRVQEASNARNRIALALPRTDQLL